jgi:hypothetical protein
MTSRDMMKQNAYSPEMKEGSVDPVTGTVNPLSYLLAVWGIGALEGIRGQLDTAAKSFRISLEAAVDLWGETDVNTPQPCRMPCSST